ncbi:hypothetical protein [Teredinibacter sp. KSP-S5-2]|uniref:hypothetical protein n=1 Tax=Teredinibacter sp. KSP-S5-2 TaxID=3034506 RepID=UPI002934F829|nr:hypothetical protein [Teredinibacter sp. KSP-S5-2]WNO11285.1 hypothetical protein P5V12_08885 [Teredinibacter sp. KSP-S5-2]
MKYLANVFLMVTVCSISICAYDHFYVKNYTDYGALTISDSEGNTRLELGEFTSGEVKKFGVQVRDENNIVRAFYGVSNSNENMGSTPQIILYDQSGAAILSAFQVQEETYFSVGEINSENSVLLNSGKDSAVITVKGNDDNGIMNEIGIIASEEPALALFSHGNAVSLHAKEKSKSIMIARQGIRVWESKH